VIADQCLNHVERFIIDEGHTTQRTDRDYGYDLLLFTYDEQGYVEPGFVAIQLKAAETLEKVGSAFVYDVDIRDYNLWMWEELPVVLILFDASQRRAYWLDVHRFFTEDISRQPKKDGKSVRVRIPQRQSFNHRAVALLRGLKSTPKLKLIGGDE
jgi:hypothetical protein